ncbi:low molecular mass early light-inducible protein HV90, chloroplastic-like [Phragmites australis]|uniref:low molecular mass early light-inducible protein HV90, chloroplastic-like n=1 Tax=Phragmites australis TaxID=29695 RepID=UPI002D7809C9|nr:low molecular mass early light-inducible protein HV90, chloroplastic-like [Phragmites australis]
MATTMTASMSSLVVAAAGVRAGRFPARLPAAGLAPRRCALVVRAQRKPEMNPTEEMSAKPKASPGLWDALAFSGPAPERINGRLAMVGFVSALAVEASRGDGLLSQAGSSSGLTWFAYTVVALSVASLVPLLQGESAEGRSGGFMTADAELWNGRFAMLGLVALAVTEYLTGAPFINA